LERTFALNHLALFLLTSLLLDRLTASAPFWIVAVSSGAHASGRIDFDDLQGERNCSGQRAYSQSKLANVMFTYELARRLAGTGVTATVLRPGRDLAVLHEVHTGSWLGRRYQGQGIGTQMRAPVLHLAFGELGARWAVSAAFEDNPASIGVSRILGYRDDGIEWHLVRGRPALTRRLHLERAGWQATRTFPVQIHGLPPCLPLFGLLASS
jgi:NAD(P)-dependent dehydrogenase (short-subunit alcohol dehydrogenase family)